MNIATETYLLNNFEITNIFLNQPLQYNSPYTLDEIITKTEELNTIELPVDRTKSIAVVGNSGKLLDEEYGELIDSHDIVIRCNLALIDGFERHVGTKKDFRVIAGKSFWRDIKHTFSSYDNNFLTSLENEQFLIKANPIAAAIQGIIKNYNTTSKISYIRQEVIDNIEQRMGTFDTSAGLTAIELATQWSANVSIFGFGFFEEGWETQHYFETIKPYIRGHNPSEEKEYVNNLALNNKIRVY